MSKGCVESAKHPHLVRILISNISHGAIGLRRVPPVLFQFVVDFVAESLVFGILLVVFGWVDLSGGCVHREG